MFIYIYYDVLNNLIDVGFQTEWIQCRSNHHYHCLITVSFNNVINVTRTFLYVWTNIKGVFLNIFNTVFYLLTSEFSFFQYI